MKSNLLSTTLCMALGCALAMGGEARFASKPSVAKEGDTIRISFAVSEPCDVEVGIVDQDGKVIRHLAAGMLGENPPEPLQKGLNQTLTWDLKDDNGQRTDRGDTRVRVRLGMKPQFERIIGWSGKWLGELCGMTVGPDGMLYVLHRGDWVPHRHTWMIVAFDRNGSYHHQVYPARGDLPPEKRKGWSWITTADGQELPPVQNLLNRSVHPAAAFQEVTPMLVTNDGRLIVAGGGLDGYRSEDPDIRGGRRLLIMGADGSVPENFLGPVYAPANYAGNAGAALSPDEKHVYIAGLGELGGKKDDKVKLCHVVWKIGLTPDSKPEVFIGKLFQPGKGSDGLNDPRGLAVDKDGNVYVADAGNNRIAIFNPNGSFHGEISVEHPELVNVSRKSGEIAVMTIRPDPKKRLLGAILTFESIKAATGKAVVGPLSGKGPDQALFAMDDSGEKPAYFYGGVGFGDNQIFRAEKPNDKFFAGYARFGRKPEGDMGFSGDLAYVNGLLLTAGDSSWGFKGDKWEAYDAATGAYKGHWPDGKSGKEKPKTGHGELVSGKDGNLYTQIISGMISRFAADGCPLPFAVKGDNKISDLFQVHSRQTGLFATRDGTIYAETIPSENGAGKPSGGINRMKVIVYGADGKVIEPCAALIEGARTAGIAVDRKGNIYMGVNAYRKGEEHPDWIKGGMPKDATPQMQATYTNVATIFKFPPKGGHLEPDEKGEWMAGRMDAAPAKVAGALWSVRAGLVPKKMLVTQGCYCETTRFDIDGYDRLFVPDPLRFSVLVVDSAGNAVKRFGNYGNMENRGPGSAGQNPEIRFAWPLSTRCADDRVFVADAVNMRIMSVKLEWAEEATCAVK